MNIKKSWKDLLCGYSYNSIFDSINYNKILESTTLFAPNVTLNDMLKSGGIIDFVDSSVMNSSLVNTYDFDFVKNYSHMEIYL